MRIFKYLLNTCGGPSDILTTPTTPLENFPVNPESIEKMLYLIRKNKALGLAAPQVGISQRFFILNRIGFRVFVNPVIDLLGSDVDIRKEGCLSFPWMDVDVSRANVVRLNFQDERGRNLTETFQELEARTVLHEVDHLNGIGIWDYLKQP